MEQQGLTEQEIQVILSGDRNAIAALVKTSGDIVCCVVQAEPDKKEADKNDDQDFGNRQKIA